MLTFYYSKGSSAVAAHILLEDVGAVYRAVEVSIPDGAHKAQSFLKRAPKGRIPVLKTPKGVLSENPAILEYIATQHRDGQYLPQGAFARSQARSLCAYLCGTAHVAFAHHHRGARWATNPSSLTDMQAKVPENLTECANFLENDCMLSPWACGERYTFCDPYLFQFTRWLQAVSIDLGDFPKLAAHRAAMMSRVATRTVLDVHGLV